EGGLHRRNNDSTDQLPSDSRTWRGDPECNRPGGAASSLGSQGAGFVEERSRASPLGSQFDFQTRLVGWVDFQESRGGAHCAERLQTWQAAARAYIGAVGPVPLLTRAPRMRRSTTGSNRGD